MKNIDYIDMLTYVPPISSIIIFCEAHNMPYFHTRTFRLELIFITKYFSSVSELSHTSHSSSLTNKDTLYLRVFTPNARKYGPE